MCNRAYLPCVHSAADRLVRLCTSRRQTNGARSHGRRGRLRALVGLFGLAYFGLGFGIGWNGRRQFWLICEGQVRRLNPRRTKSPFQCDGGNGFGFGLAFARCGTKRVELLIDLGDRNGQQVRLGRRVPRVLLGFKVRTDRTATIRSCPVLLA